MTRAPAAAARADVSSLDPSSITRISCHAPAARRSATSGPTDAASLNAGMTIDVAALACGGLRRRAAGDRPGAAFVLANCEEGNITEQVVAGADHAVEARLFQTEIGEKRRRIGGVELSDLELDLPAYSHGRRRRSVQER